MKWFHSGAVVVILFFLIKFVSDASIVRAESALIVVDDDGPADFATIQAAINAAATSDTILIKNGTYRENVVVNRTVSLVGESCEASVVDGNQKEFAFALVSSGITVSNLTLGNTNQANRTCGFGIVANEVADCLVQGNVISRNYYGVKIASCINFTMKGNRVVDNAFFGVVIEDSSFCTVDDSVIQSNMYTGINITSSDYCRVFGNSLARSNRCIAIKYSDRCVIGENAVEKAVYYGIEVISSSDVWIGNNSANENFHLGVSVQAGVNCTVTQNVVKDNKNFYGLEIVSSADCRATGNTLKGNFYGVMLKNSRDCEVSRNDVSESSIGAQIYASDNSHIRGNTISNISDYALYCSSSNNCSVSGNTVTNNRYYGIWVYNSNDNMFFHNNLVNNTYHAFSSGVANSWNQSGEGNYWGDYAGRDRNLDGIGDTPYTIASNNMDYHPLFGRFSSFPSFQESAVQIISNSTVSDFVYEQDNQTIRFNVNGQDLTIGFCRVCIPHTVMNETYRVTVDGAEPAIVNYTLFDDGERRWLYFSYMHSSREVEIVPESASLAGLSFLLLFLAIVRLLMKRTLF